MTIKVICLNLWLGGKFMDKILDFLEQENPDLLLQQEVYNSEDSSLPAQFRSIETIQNRLNFKAHHFAPSVRDNRPEGKIDQGNAIFSKFPIIDTSVTFYDRPYDPNHRDEPEFWPNIPRNLQHVVVQAGSTKLNVFNTQGVWDLDGDNYSDQRQVMADQIIQSTKDLPNVILAGDLNAKPTNQAIRDIGAHLTSVFGDQLTSTFNMKHKTNPGYSTAAVDMIFVSPDLKVISHDCPKVDISDHLPLVTTIELD